MQLMTQELDAAMREVGLKLHPDKTKVLTNADQKTAKPMVINGHSIEVLLHEASVK